jgi:sigma-E factor negative regulatory protein RseC
MLTETGVIVEITPDAIWVETIQKSTCGACAARSGCGQRVLGEALRGASRLKVLLNGLSADDLRIDQCVTIGIPERVVVAGALGAYLGPLLLMIVFLLVADWLELPELVMAASAFAGLALGALIVRFFSRRHSMNPDLQPLLLEPLLLESDVVQP